MNPNRLHTFTQESAPAQRPKTHAVIRAPRQSRGGAQKRCFDCDAYDECLDIAVEGGDGWRRGFDCGGCPSAVNAETIPIGTRQEPNGNDGRVYRPRSEILRAIAIASAMAPASTGSIAKRLGATSTSLRRRLSKLNAEGIVVYHLEPITTGERKMWKLTELGLSQLRASVIPPSCEQSDT